MVHQLLPFFSSLRIFMTEKY